MRVSSFTKDVPEFLRVVQWCYDSGLGWVINASSKDGAMAIHLDLPASDMRAKRFKQLVDDHPSWTVIADANSPEHGIASGH